MNILPKNRHLLIEVVVNRPEEKSTILVPDDYSVSYANEYEVANVLALSGDCDSTFRVGQQVLVEGQMIKNISVLDKNFQLVLENYVIATVGDVET